MVANNSVERDRPQATLVGSLRGFAATAAPHVKRWAAMNERLIAIAMVLVLVLVFVAPVAYADCRTAEKTLFSCLTAKGKRIEVCNFGQTIQYAFGKSKKTPELSISVPLSKVKGMSCYTCGRYISNSVYIPNGNTIYNVFWGGDKLSDTGETEGGVEIIVNGESKARIACASAPFINNSEGILFTEPEAGE